MTHTIGRREWTAVLALLLLAFALRTIDLTRVPPGLHNDEVADAEITESVTHGRLAIFFPENIGNEGLYYYFAAPFMDFIGNSIFALRLPPAFLSLISACIIWALARRLFGPVVALTALAGFTIAFWPVAFGRILLHVVMEVPLAALSAYAFWRAREVKGRRALGLFVVSGLCVGLAIDAYTAARILPFIFVVFGGYVLIARRTEWRQWWRGIAIGLVAAFLAALPLFVVLAQSPAEDQLGFFDIDRPFTELKQGNLQPVLKTSLNTLGMFAFVGDPLPYYDVPNRPVFEPIGALLLAIGLLIAAWRWRRPEYAFVFVWFFVSLAPGMLSQPAPNYTRTIGVQVVAFTLPGLAIAELLQRYRSKIVYAGLALLLAGNLAWTVHDYFVVWPSIDTVRFWYQAGLKAVADRLQNDPDTSPVVVCAPDHLIDENQPWWYPAREHLHVLLHRPDISLRYNNCVDSMIFVSSPARYAFPDAASVDALQAFAPFAALQAAGLDYEVLPDRLGVIVRADGNGAERLSLWLNQRIGEAETSFSTASYAPEAGGQSAKLPMDFANKVDFLGYTLSTASPKRGSSFDLVTYWHVREALPAQLSQFTHVLNANGDIVTQIDRLMLTSASLQPGDVFVQIHHVALPGNLKAGEYSLSVGLYTPTDHTRLPIIANEQLRGDRLFLQPIEVTK